MAALENKITPLGEALKNVFQDLGLEKELFRARVIPNGKK
jgi:hypothetical protein